MLMRIRLLLVTLNMGMSLLIIGVGALLLFYDRRNTIVFPTWVIASGVGYLGVQLSRRQLKEAKAHGNHA